MGCGGGKYEVAPVSGICSCNGEPITAGLVVFEPIPAAGADLKESGRAAAGVLNEDGSFVLSTYGQDDGAIIGEHRVRVFAPALEDDDAPLTDANRYACGNEPLEQTVTLGKNFIELDLKYVEPKTARRKSR